jgi:hypothetical protein
MSTLLYVPALSYIEKLTSEVREWNVTLYHVRRKIQLDAVKLKFIDVSHC